MATATAEVGRSPVVIEEGMGPKVARTLGRLPIHLVLIAIAVFWLIPTTGLFITSLLSPDDAASGGWWNFFAKPSTWTLENYRNIFHNEGITHALWVTAQVTLGAPILPMIVASLAGYPPPSMVVPGRECVFLVGRGLLLVPI